MSAIAGGRDQRVRSAPFVLAVGGVALWWLVAVWQDSVVLPTPADAWVELLDNLGDDRFRSSVGVTVWRMALAYVGVVVVGSPVGFALGMTRFWSDVMSPLLYAVYSVPKIVLYPLFLVILGLGDVGQIAFAFVSGVLPMTIMVMEGAASVPRSHLRLAASLRMRRAQVVRSVVLPATMPSFVSALRLTFGLTFLGLLIAEMFTGLSGLGYEILRNVPLARMGDIVAVVLLVVALALVPALLLRAVEVRVHHRFGSEAP